MCARSRLRRCVVPVKTGTHTARHHRVSPPPTSPRKRGEGIPDPRLKHSRTGFSGMTARVGSSFRSICLKVVPLGQEPLFYVHRQTLAALLIGASGGLYSTRIFASRTIAAYRLIS